MYKCETSREKIASHSLLLKTLKIKGVLKNFKLQLLLCDTWSKQKVRGEREAGKSPLTYYYKKQANSDGVKEKINNFFINIFFRKPLSEL